MRLTALIATSVAMVSFAAEGQEIILRAGSVAPESTPWERQIKRTRDRISDLTDGSVKMKIYLGGRKGDEKSLVRQARDGRIEFIGVSAAALATEVPALQILELPFLFESTEEADFILDNYLREPVAEILAKNGYVFAQWAENGWQNFALKDGFVKGPKDLKGRKVRSQESALHLMTWRNFGASPIEMAVSEVLPALNTGMVEGFGQTPLFMFATGWYQGVEYYTVSRHVYQPALMVYSKKWFDGQTAKTKQALTANEKEETLKGRQQVRAIEPALLKNLEAAGLNVYTLSTAERSAFAQSAKAVHQKFMQNAPNGAGKLMQAIKQGKAAYKNKKG